jgi:hypothetical protein
MQVPAVVGAKTIGGTTRNAHSRADARETLVDAPPKAESCGRHANAHLSGVWGESPFKR